MTRTTSKPVIVSPAIATGASSLLSATKISDELGLSRNKINPLLAELGLIDKVANGWIATALGAKFGAMQKRGERDDRPYVLWSDEILTNQVFVEELLRLAGKESEKQDLPTNSKESEFRHKFPADY